MDDDWQDAALLTNRHFHNRVGKQGRAGKGGKRSNGAFDVHKTFGTYEVKCPAAAAGKIGFLENGGGRNAEVVGRLEMYNLNELGNALVGELVLPGALRGSVILAGSRKGMMVAVRAFEEDEEEEEEEEEGETEEQDKEERGGDEGDRDDIEDDDGHSNEEEEEDDHENQRHRQFEKNSFRSPKFWLKWQGEILSEASTVENGLREKNEESPDQIPGPAAVESRNALVTDSGYLVFSSNNCDKFQGTLSCQSLGWDNVKVSGWKIKSQPARDFDVQWIS